MSYRFPKFTKGNTAFQKALNDVVNVLRLHGVNPAGRPGWSHTKDGWMPPYISPEQIQGGTVWTLNVINPENNQVAVNLGTVLKDVSDITDPAVIVDGSEEFNVAPGDLIWLLVEYDQDEEELVVTLESGSTWNQYPKAFETTGSGSTVEWVATRYVLYKFVDTATSDTIPIGEGLHAIKIVGDYHLAAIVANFHNKGTTDKPVTGFTLIPYHKAISA